VHAYAGQTVRRRVGSRVQNENVVTSPRQGWSH
jgi:hypothetical protein